MITFIDSNDTTQSESAFLGLAPFLRLNIAGTDLLPIGQEMKARLERDPEDANRWMNLSTVMLCLGQRDMGLAIQSQGLDIKRIYLLPALQQPAKLRLLMLMVPGDLAANTPLDCLLENSDIDLIYYYVSPDSPLYMPIPEHDALMVAISESDDNLSLLASLELALSDWPKPVINAPRNIPSIGRCTASLLLQNTQGLLMPPTMRISRSELLEIANGNKDLPMQVQNCDFPIILRPAGSHAGRDLERIANFEDIAAYLSRVDGAEFFLARFIDYSGEDGMFRKYRIALVNGVAFACHMAVSANWMIHYVNAGMYEDAQKRAEEAGFMANFDDFARRHQSALDAIFTRTKLDYLCLDCSETRDGQLLVFEIDHAMVVHAMDLEHMFPYKRQHMQKLQNAFRDFLFRLTADRRIELA